MPIYEYKCKTCGHTTEKLRSFREADEAAPCEKCQGETKRTISKTSFILSGGGWASDGYSSSGSSS